MPRKTPTADATTVAAFFASAPLAQVLEHFLHPLQELTEQAALREEIEHIYAAKGITADERGIALGLVPSWTGSADELLDAACALARADAT